jgi:hypothetical protein
MNGTLKSLFGGAALWACGGFAWAMIVGVAAALAGKGMGTALTVAMVTAWGSALVISLLVVALSKIVFWRWMPAEAGARWVLLLILIVAQLATFFMEVFSVFVIFNR